MLGRASLFAIAVVTAPSWAATMAADVDPSATGCTFYVAPKWNPLPSDYGPPIAVTPSGGQCLSPINLATFPVGPFTFKATATYPAGPSGDSIPLQTARPGPPAAATNPTLVASGGGGGGGNPVNFGETSVLPTADGGNANLLIAQNASLPSAGTLQTLSFYVRVAGGALRLGLYDATGPGGGPGAKLAETAAFTPSAQGWITQPVITPVALAAGTYWLAYLPASNALGFSLGTKAGVSSRYFSFTFGTMPATFSTTPTTDANHWSMFGTVQ